MTATSPLPTPEELRARFAAHEARIRDQVLPEDLRAGFDGLKFFEPDPAYQVIAHGTLEQTPSVVEMITTRGEQRAFHRWGRVRFTLPGGEASLAVFGPVSDATPQRLFTSFRDRTSGRETYAAGRSVAVTRDGDAFVIDFNEAYNFYCAYGDRWNCALPPAENWLDLEIRAGEKAYH
ncbi:hypothetical protein HNR42_000708 [Deinobacterium chartae]|uniref:DUF1684 domain-containing protein n=1 Tax=Deinobacterium chartae TaxID=521158 RepID=A0A841HXC2_9DEIO|nr:DUF1684 domain-containing protein [Deinobacterium chartae]MBB6097294.1 hypothetical protein [Deinobacterium chartae]